MPDEKRKILRLKVPGANKASDVIYRVAMNTLQSEWNIYRNGVKTGKPRRKKHSAIAVAIRDAQAELPAADGKILVTIFEGGRLTTEWTSPDRPN